MGPAPLGLLGGQDGVVDGLLGLAAPAEMVGEQLDHLVEAPGVELFERRAHRGVIHAPAALEQSAVDDFLGEGVLEAVEELVEEEDEVEGLERPEALGHGRSVASSSRDSRATANWRPTTAAAWSVCLSGSCEPVDASGDDVVDGVGHPHVRLAQPRRPVLDKDAASLPELADDLLEIERIALALRDQQLDERPPRPRVGAEQGADHPPDVARAEPARGRSSRPRRREPRRRGARARAQEQQHALSGERGRQVPEEFLGAGVEPVDVLDDDDERLAAARAEQHRGDGAEGPLLELGGREAGQEFRRRGGAEEMGEQDRRLLVVDPEAPEARGDAIADVSPLMLSVRPRARRSRSRIGWYGIARPWERQVASSSRPPSSSIRRRNS